MNKKTIAIARGVGAIGAVAALVAGVTFALLTSNTVALSPNNLTTATASLAIGAAGTCPQGDTSVTPGLSDSSLAPGDSTSVTFCLDNKSNVPLKLTASIPQDLSGSVAAQNTTLAISCSNQGDVSAALSNFGNQTFTTALPANTQDTCTAKATLSPSYSGSGGEAISAFTVNFVGNEPAPAI